MRIVTDLTAAGLEPLSDGHGAREAHTSGDGGGDRRGVAVGRLPDGSRDEGVTRRTIHLGTSLE